MVLKEHNIFLHVLPVGTTAGYLRAIINIRRNVLGNTCLYRHPARGFRVCICDRQKGLMFNLTMLLYGSYYLSCSLLECIRHNVRWQR